MPFDACLPAIEAAAGRALTKKEQTELYEQLKGRMRKIRAENRAATTTEALTTAAAEISDDLKLSALIEKRNAVLNAQRHAEALHYVETTWADKPERGIEALLVGTKYARQGARASIAAEQHSLAASYVGGMISDVERLGRDHLALFTSGTIDRDITRALWSIDNPDAPPFKGQKEAQSIAEVIHRWQEQARLDANRAGAYVGKLPGYVVRQSHDSMKISAAGAERWKADILPRLDLAKTVPIGQSAAEFLDETYKSLISGIHPGAASEKAEGFKGPANLAKKVSQERVLHFKDADSWFDYNATYGKGNLRESLLGGLERDAKAVGLMRTLGTNPEAMLQRIYGEVEKRLRKESPEKAEAFRKSQRWLNNRLAEVDGRTSSPVNGQIARVSANVRAWESMAKLGGALISSISDVFTYGSELKYQGRSLLGGMAEAIGGLTKGRGTAEQREILSSLGVFFDTARGELARRFSADDSFGGSMSRGMGLFFKANGLSWWTDTMKASAGLSMAHRLAGSKGKAWGALDSELQRALGLYGLDEGKWDIIRSAESKLADGRDYLTPDQVSELADAAFEPYLSERGIEPTPARVRDLRQETASQLRQYFSDRVQSAVIEPDARTRATMRQGTRPGTPEGELLRFIGQFKSFPIAYLQRVVQREIYGRGADSMGQALRNGHGEMQALGQMMLWTTLFGYGAMAVKDLIKGRTPRPPDDPKTWIAAASQGGGLGIYGDFLFGHANRLGGGAIGSAAGPVAGAAEDVVDLWQRIRDGDDVAATAFRDVLNHTPFLNLFYTRAALDYLFLYRIQEALNPGSIRRMERRVENENHQTFLVRPSEFVK